MWAALTALFVVLLITIACSVVWIVGQCRRVPSTDPHPGRDRGHPRLSPRSACHQNDRARAWPDEGGPRAFHDRVSLHRRAGRLACPRRFHAGDECRARAAAIHARRRETRRRSHLSSYDHTFGMPGPKRDKVSSPTCESCSIGCSRRSDCRRESLRRRQRHCPRQVTAADTAPPAVPLLRRGRKSAPRPRINLDRRSPAHSGLGRKSNCPISSGNCLI